jgi:hypothetical protein
MKQTSIKLITTAAEVLNHHVSTGTAAGEVLKSDNRNTLLGVVNDILVETAEGGRLVAAVESDGSLLGFVPRMSVPIPELPAPPTSPDKK